MLWWLFGHMRRFSCHLSLDMRKLFWNERNIVSWTNMKYRIGYFLIAVSGVYWTLAEKGIWLYLSTEHSWANYRVVMWQWWYFRPLGLFIVSNLGLTSTKCIVFSHLSSLLTMLLVSKFLDLWKRISYFLCSCGKLSFDLLLPL